MTRWDGSQENNLAVVQLITPCILEAQFSIDTQREHLSHRDQ